MLFELSGLEVLVGFIALGLILVLGILVFRFFYQYKKTPSFQIEDANGVCLANRTKYANKNVSLHRTRFLGLGLTFSLLFTIFAMSWTVYERTVPILDIFTIETEEIEVMPRTLQLPPPPPPPKMTEIIVDDIIEVEQDDLEDVTPDLFEEVSFELPSPPKDITSPPPPPPLPLIEEEPSDLPFRVVEKNPMFGNCTDKSCSDVAFLKYMYQHISYPSLAQENGIEGRVTAQFVIERDGYISDIKILRGIGAGCDQEVIDVLKRMNHGGPAWKPGEQRGKRVRVLYTLPVTYSLK